MTGSSCLAGLALWIDESVMNLYEILGFQPKDVATLWFSSSKRPAYSGMTVMRLVCLAVTLTFDSSPIKGEGDLVVLDLITRAQAALWILP